MERFLKFNFWRFNLLSFSDKRPIVIIKSLHNELCSAELFRIAQLVERV